MSFDWEDFLKVAEILHDGAAEAKLSEAMYRIAISRAYYAAFCLARDWKIAKGVRIPIKDPHKFVIDLYVDAESEIEADIGYKLRRLRQRRSKADYENIIASVKELSRESIKEAREILIELAKLK